MAFVQSSITDEMGIVSDVMRKIERHWLRLKIQSLLLCVLRWICHNGMERGEYIAMIGYF